MIKQIIHLVIIIFLISSCSSQIKKVGALAGEGWQAFEFFRTSDSPGTIFRVNPKGEVYRVAVAEVTIHQDPIGLFKLESQTKFSFNEVLDLLNIEGVDFPVNLKGDLELSSSAIFGGSNGIRDLIDDTSDYAIEKSLSTVGYREDNKYFVIRETISSKDAKITLSNEGLLKADFIAELKNVFSNNSNIELNATDKLVIDASLSSAHRLWYKAEKLRFSKTSSAGSDGSTFRVTVDTNSVDEIPSNLSLNASETFVP
ncbi:hypothetical protein KO519_16290 [Paraglaciecola agarilytica]|uniref:hypothetical protein n=1 Tax=Paraglaciecola chathamensis TaxID=368405 RepID=UPI001C091164|nr:hypothetical protein [Paraglaciecola agarilytica]MBU3019240.1 hypothetical protein [Paraglaciecola agarilytica]